MPEKKIAGRQSPENRISRNPRVAHSALVPTRQEETQRRRERASLLRLKNRSRQVK